MNKSTRKKLQRILLVYWTLIAIFLVIAIGFISNFDYSGLQRIITKIAIIYVFSSAILAGIIKKLGE